MADLHDTLWVDARLARLRVGDVAARDELVAAATGRLERLAHAMLRGQFGRVGRWADTEDVFQGAAVRLWKALAAVAPDSPLHFHRLAARHVRLELIDLARHHYGLQGGGAHHESVAADAPGPDPAAASDSDPGRAAEWGELHAQVQALPDDEAAVTDLLFYQGLGQDEAATLLGVDVRTVQRRWQRARRKLGDLLAGSG